MLKPLRALGGNMALGLSEFIYPSQSNNLHK
ncbi:MAG: hypothetical protein ACI854_002829 [Arenicella sp.]|jgi:hypothetical protein